MTKTKFVKRAATPEQLLQKLEMSGLIVSERNRDYALNYLRFVGGYRLKGYWYHLVDPISKRFPEGYSFEQISARYEIDRELRAATISASNDKKAISKKFGIGQPEVFESWIHMLTVIRNIAAHHGQFLNVKLGVAPSDYKSGGIKFSEPKSFFSAATVIHVLLNKTGLPHVWRSDLDAIFNKFPTVDIADLGFPKNWQTSIGW